MILELGDEERDLLIDIPTGRLEELREEVYHAPVSSYKDSLKEREAMVKQLLTRLGAELET